jgi:hypothetical protein
VLRRAPIWPSAWDYVHDLEETTGSRYGSVEDKTATTEDGCVLADAFSYARMMETLNFFGLMRSHLAVADTDDHPLELYNDASTMH